MVQSEAPSDAAAWNSRSSSLSIEANRQDQERQQDIGGAEDHAELVVQEADRRRRQAEPLERAVDHAVVAEDHDPGIGAHQDADPERQHDQRERDQLPAGRQAAHPVRERVAQHDAHRGRNQRDPRVLPSTLR
jgi:hypothetical protein